MSKKKKIRIHSEPDTSEEGNETEKSNFDANQTKNPEPEKTENESLAPPDLLKELEAKLADQEREAKEAHDRLLRVSADFENYKKRTERENSKYKSYIMKNKLKKLINV